MTIDPRTGTNPATESRNSEGRIRGERDARDLPRVDGRAEERVDPALPPRPPHVGGEVRLSDPPRASGAIERLLRSERGHAVSGPSTPRGTGLRIESLAGADERDAPKVLPPHGSRSHRPPRGLGDLGRDDPRRGTRPGGSPMTSSDAYLADVRRAMAGMDTSIRDDILRELQGHIAESAAANGGNLEVSLTSLGPAREVGRHYREVYGYGRVYQVLFAVVAFLLAVPSVPVLIVGADFLFPFSLSLLFVVGAAMWILWVSVAAGSRAGMFAGVAGLAARLVAFIAVARLGDVLAGACALDVRRLGQFRPEVVRHLEDRALRRDVDAHEFRAAAFRFFDLLEGAAELVFVHTGHLSHGVSSHSYLSFITF